MKPMLLKRVQKNTNRAQKFNELQNHYQKSILLNIFEKISHQLTKNVNIEKPLSDEEQKVYCKLMSCLSQQINCQNLIGTVRANQCIAENVARLITKILALKPLQRYIIL